MRIKLYECEDTWTEWFEDTFIHPIRWRLLNVYRNFRNIYRYGPLVWSMREYDQVYLYRTLETKFKWMARHHKASNNEFMDYVGSNKVYKVIKECQILARRLAEDEFAEYWRNRIPDMGTSDMIIWEDVPGTPLRRGTFVKDDGYWRPLKLWGTKQDEQRAWAKARLFSLMHKHIDRMWD